jgi:hypothetical protein
MELFIPRACDSQELEPASCAEMPFGFLDEARPVVWSELRESGLVIPPAVAQESTGAHRTRYSGSRLPRGSRRTHRLP